MWNSATEKKRSKSQKYFLNNLSPNYQNIDHKFKAIIGQSPKVQKVFQLITKVADDTCNIIIQGETGTGKELVARAIHQTSYRKHKPFIPINCGAIPENLLESELFGHVRGAFTGATSAKSGKFELANEGTLFLDEIGDMGSKLQVKLLRVLENKEFMRVGGSTSVNVDVRIISATHQDLEEAVEKGTFREDLYYRLNVIPINLPPLRERRPDIPLLLSHFLALFNEQKGKKVENISDKAMEILMSYSWAGNIRELKNLVERIVVLKEEGGILPEDLPKKLRENDSRRHLPNIEISDEGICFNTAVNEFEKALILQSLVKTNGVKNKAAQLLSLNRTTLVEKIKKHSL